MYPKLKVIIFALLALTISTSAFAKETVVFWFGATQDERAAYEQMIRDFNRAHPNIEVQGMLVPQSYVERKLLLSVAGDVPPDVVRFYTHLGGEMMSRGALEPLDELMSRDKFDLSDFYRVGIQQNTYGKHLYGVPWILSPEALFYNKRLFREAGLDPNNPPKTWDELRRYALKLTKRDKDGNIEQIGFAGFMNNPPDFHRYLWQNGGAPLTPDLKHIAFNSKEGFEALTWMRDFLVQEAGPVGKNISPEEASAQAFSNLQTFSSSFSGATQDVFGLEKLAMRIESPFRIPDLKKYFPNLDYGIAQVPYNKVKAVEVVGNSLVIPRGSKHKEAAWVFIKFAASREQMLKVCQVAGRVPARRSAALDPAFYSNVNMQPFINQIDYGRTTPIAPGYREVSDTLARKIEAALKGTPPAESTWTTLSRWITRKPAPKVIPISPETALNQAAVKGQEILNVANEDVSKYPVVQWGKVAFVAGLVLVLAIGVGWFFVLKNTKNSRRDRQDAKMFYAFLSPWLIGFVVLTFGSTVASLMLSFCRWDILSPARFVGFHNLSSLFMDDPRFIKAIGNTLYYAAFSVPLAIVGGLCIAVLMNQKVRGIQVFRTIYYLPVVVSGVATALLWQFIFNPKTGVFNKILGPGILQPAQWMLSHYMYFSIMLTVIVAFCAAVLVHRKLHTVSRAKNYITTTIITLASTALLWRLAFNPHSGLLVRIVSLVAASQPPKWLLDPDWSKPAFIIMALWGVGGAMIIYLAGLQGVPEELYEAARLDGANPWQTFRKVTLPLLTPTIFYQLIIGTMAAFQFFTPAYIMTGGGPEDSTLFYSLYLFKNAFEWMKMGYASAMAWILFAVVLGVTILQFKGAKKWVYYEGSSEE